MSTEPLGDQDEDVLPEGPELEAVRKEIAARAAETTERFEARLGNRRVNEPATLEDLIDLVAITRAEMIAFTTTHTRRRCVMRDEVLPTDTTARTLAPLWAGFWQDGGAYAKGALVGHAHGLWLAERATTGKPGTADSGFRLIVKRPR